MSGTTRYLMPTNSARLARAACYRAWHQAGKVCAPTTVRTPDRAHNSFSIVIESDQTRRAVVFTVHAHAALSSVVAAKELSFNVI